MDSYPGENMPGDDTQENPTLPPRFRMGGNPTVTSRHMYDPGPGRPGTFWERVGNAVNEGFRGTPGAPTKFNTQAALAEIHPGLPAAWEGTKWAFRGSRTTATYSPYREQNVYGGVQRDSMPTTRISTWSPTETANQGRMERRREWLNESEYYPPGPDHDAALPAGLPPGAGADPINTTGASMRPGSTRSDDPLFNQNTGQGLNVNPAQFDPHQRSTSGL